MKKFAKMSLVAAVAVAGMTTANAKDLTEAIKNVDVSGTVVYRYDDRNSDTGGNNATSNKYKLAVNVKAPINEDFALQTRFTANDGFAGLNTGASNDNAEAFDIELTNVAFVYTGVKNTTVIAGKQALSTPWTVGQDSDDKEQFGNGILALSTWGPVTVAGAYFNQTNLDQVNDSALTFDGGEDIMTVGVMANVGPVALDAWYLDLDDNEDSAAGVAFDSYTFGAKYSLALDAVKLGLDARYTAIDLDDSTADNSLWKAALSAKMGMFGASIAYGATDEQGGTAALENDAKTGFQGWTTNLNGQADADLIKFNVNAQVLSSLNIALNYNELDSDSNDANDKEEVYTQITWKPSKNMTSYIRLGEYEQGTGTKQKSDIGRLQVQYSF